MTRWRLTPDEWRVVLVAGLVSAFTLADVLTGGPLTHLDGQIRAAVQPRPPATAVWLTVAGAAGDLGFAAAALAIIGLVTAQAMWRIWPLALAMGNLAAVEVAVLVLKSLVGRPGPGESAGLAGYPGFYPSGHTATAAVATGTVVFLGRVGWSRTAPLMQASWLALISGLAMGSLAAIQAVLGDFHWASDCLGGLALAVLVLVPGFALTRTHLARSPGAAADLKR
jgi:undecaprenyl-diphosphatase